MSRVALAIISGCLIASSVCAPLSAFAQSSKSPLSAEELAAASHVESVDIVDDATLTRSAKIYAGGVSTNADGTNQNGMQMNGMQMNGMNNNMQMNGMNNNMQQMNGMNNNMQQMNGMNNGMQMNGMNNNMQMNGMNNGMQMNGMNNGMQMNGYGSQMMPGYGMNGYMPMNGMYSNGNMDADAAQRAIGVAGTTLLLGTFLGNGGIGGMMRSVGWGNTGFHSHGLCGY